MSMNNKFLIAAFTAVMFVSQSFNSWAQDEKKSNNEKGSKEADPAVNNKAMSWSIGVYGGAINPFTDIRSNPILSRNSWGWDVGLHVTKWVNSFLGFRGNVVVGEMIGTSAYRDSKNFPAPLTGKELRNQTSFWSGDMMLMLNFSGLSMQEYGPSIYKQKKRKFAYYGFAGIGYTSYEAKNFDRITGEEYKKYMMGYSGKVREISFPFGLGMSYRLSKKLQIDIEGGMRAFASDKLDGVVIDRLTVPVGNSGDANETVGRNNDAMWFLNLGLTYTLGKKGQERSRFWSQPVAAYYEDNTKKDDLKKMIDDLRKETDNKIADLESRIKSDSDNDGVSDMFDKEPNTKWDLSGVKPSEAGWTADEVRALQDKANSNYKIIVDGGGTAMDIDRDGVPDHLDKCPFEPGIAANNGCKIKPNAETIKILTDLQQLEFELDKDNFVDCSKKPNKKAQQACAKKQATDMENLKRLAEILNTPEYSSAKLRIEGHCDDRGTVEYNIDLSQRRCNTTKEKLVSLGVAANRIITVGKGKSSPRVGPSGKNGTFTEFERDRNRRTEFTLE